MPVLLIIYGLFQLNGLSPAEAFDEVTKELKVCVGFGGLILV